MLTITGKELVHSIITIDDLRVGDLFLHGGCVHIKIETIKDTLGESFNAIALDENYNIGECFYIDEDDVIIPLDGELTIKRKNL